MITQDWIIIGLFIFIIGQQVWHSIQSQILINKIMSRSYADYEDSKPIEDDDEEKQTHPKDERDLSYLNGFIAK